MFYTLWILKESYSKYVGKGLTTPFETLSFKQESKEVTFRLDNGQIIPVIFVLMGCGQLLHSIVYRQTSERECLDNSKTY